ncbi:MAG: hypothetical protein LBQ22_01595 [Bacteroidales bacterium]|jgi:hypothetical protein|nr:hypothetical protein [Bacteroidales bacterium]
MDNNNEIYNYIATINFKVKELSGFIKGKPELLRSFVMYISSNTKEAWRASWVLAYYSSKYHEDLNPYADEIIRALKKINIDGHIRETLKILQNLDLSEEQTSEVFDICYDLLLDNHRKPSVRSIAFQFLLKVSKEYPELKNEIIAIFENIKEYLPHGIKHSMQIRLNNNNLTK